MVALCHGDTNALELEDMVHRARTVKRGNKTSLLVAVLPFVIFDESGAQVV